MGQVLQTKCRIFQQAVEPAWSFLRARSYLGLQLWTTFEQLAKLCGPLRLLLLNLVHMYALWLPLAATTTHQRLLLWIIRPLQPFWKLRKARRRRRNTRNLMHRVLYRGHP